MQQGRHERYTLVAIIIHWLIAALVFWLIGLGWTMVDLPQGPARHSSFSLHKSLGLTVFALMLLRLAWRLTHTPPPLPTTMPAWRRAIARSTHVLFYLLLFAQPVSGYISSSFSGYTTKYFGIPLPSWAEKNPPLNEFFTELHVIFSVALTALIIAHALGALSHLFSRGDPVFRRMLPGRHRRGD